jgi:hypothetical protein
MARKNTLRDLQDFLHENPNEIEIETTSREEFIKGKPNTLVEVTEAESHAKELKSLDGVTMDEIANHIHEVAKVQNKSFAEVWLEILKEGSNQDPLLENTNIRQALRSLRVNSTAVAADTIAYLLKKGRK